MSNNNTHTKTRIDQDQSNPLWRECIRRFSSEVKAPPPDTPPGTRFYYSERALLNADDFDWFILDNGIIVREKKIESF